MTTETDTDATIILRLTAEQAADLRDVLWETTDEGPIGEGWASSRLCALRALVDEAVENGRGV